MNINARHFVKTAAGTLVTDLNRLGLQHPPQEFTAVFENGTFLQFKMTGKDKDGDCHYACPGNKAIQAILITDHEEIAV